MPQVTMPVIYSKEEVIKIIQDHAVKVAGDAVKGGSSTVECKIVPKDCKQGTGDPVPVPISYDLESITVTFQKPLRT